MTEKLLGCFKQLKEKLLPTDGADKERIDAARVTSNRLKAFNRTKANAQYYVPPKPSEKRVRNNYIENLENDYRAS